MPSGKVRERTETTISKKSCSFSTKKKKKKKKVSLGIDHVCLGNVIPMPDLRNSQNPRKISMGFLYRGVFFFYGFFV